MGHRHWGVEPGCPSIESAPQSRRDVAVVVSSWIGRHWNWGRMALAALVLVGICLLVNIEVIEFICVYIWAKLCLCARVFIRKTRDFFICISIIRFLYYSSKSPCQLGFLDSVIYSQFSILCAARVFVSYESEFEIFSSKSLCQLRI
jgi:hypothetical protein